MQNQYYWALTDEEYISHHGILGQKWGIRRYQNPDGTLTEEGKRRVYGLDENKYGIEDPYNRYKRARETIKISRKMEANQKKLDKATVKGDTKTVAKLTEKRKDLENIHKIMSKDLYDIELEYADKKMKSEVSMLIGGIVAGPIGAIAVGSIDWAKRGGFETAREFNELWDRQYADIAREAIKQQKKENSTQSNSNKQETTGSGEKKMSTKSINDKVAYAMKTGKFDMEFLERNGDLNADGDEQLKGKDLENAYKKYLEKYGYSGIEMHK